MGKPIGERTKEVKKLYVKDKLDIDEICKLMGFKSRQSFYHHKNKDGEDWDKERYENLRTEEEVKASYEKSLGKLIILFEKSINEGNLNAKEIAEYTNALNKLKSPNKDCKKEIKQVAGKAIKAITNLAYERGEESVQIFLEENFDSLIERISKIA